MSQEEWFRTCAQEFHVKTDRDSGKEKSKRTEAQAFSSHGRKELAGAWGIENGRFGLLVDGDIDVASPAHDRQELEENLAGSNFLRGVLGPESTIYGKAL